MEEKPLTEEQEYILGFNQAYVMAKYSPEIGELLPKASGKGERLAGMKAGREQYDLEIFETRMPSWLDDRTNSPEDKDLEKDTDIEPEL